MKWVDTLTIGTMVIWRYGLEDRVVPIVKMNQAQITVSHNEKHTSFSKKTLQQIRKGTTPKSYITVRRLS